MTTYECAEGSDRAHAYEQGKKRTLCGLRLTPPPGESTATGWPTPTNFPTAAPVGMEWFSDEELAKVGDRACGNCVRIDRNWRKREPSELGWPGSKRGTGN